MAECKSDPVGGCCGGKPCFSSSSAGLRAASRYPSPQVNLKSSQWKKPAPPAVPQFDDAHRSNTNPTNSDDDDPYVYSGDRLNAFAFPLGGFGTGHLVLRGDGTLQKWCVVNQTRHEALPLNDMPATFFAIRSEGQAFLLASPETYTDETTSLPPSKPAHVAAASVRRLQQLPGIAGLTVSGKYPVANVDYDIKGFPVTVAMEAMTPLVPHDTKNSSLPAAIFTFKLTNASAKAVDVSLMEAQQNFVGWDGQVDCTQPAATSKLWGGNVNAPFGSSAAPANGGGLVMTSANCAADSPYHGSLCVAGAPGASSPTAAGDPQVPAPKSIGVLTAAADEADLFASFAAGKEVPVGSPGAVPSAGSAPGKSWCGGVVQTTTVPARSTVTVTFVLTWHFPNRTRDLCVGGAYKNILPAVIGNMYSNWFKDAAAVLAYVQAHGGGLCAATRTYVDALYSSTIPYSLLDSAAGRTAVMRSPTMFWSAAGVVLGTEGNGCCPLNCTHVYGYTTLLERLFPDTARDMRVSDFVRNYDPAKGGCTMRFGTGGWAIDGALACIIKTYLVVLNADSTLAFLPTVWANVKAQMLAIIKMADADGIIRGPQQNTYDTAMLEANTFIGSYYVTALRASSKMATLMKDATFASQCDAEATLAAANYDKVCWKEDYGYYIADVTLATCKCVV